MKKILALPSNHKAFNLTKILKFAQGIQNLEKFLSVITQTQDINAKYHGWTLLHYVCYIIEYDKPLSRFIDPEERTVQRHNNLILLCKELIIQGARLDVTDNQGRMPYFFLSDPDTNVQLLDFVYQHKQLLSIRTLNIGPLHMATLLPGKYVIDLIERGEDVCVPDKLGRLPIHCVAVDFLDSMMYNARALLHFGPFTTEILDFFGKPPLYYAMKFLRVELINLLLLHTSPQTIHLTLEMLAKEELPETEKEVSDVIRAYLFDSPLYMVPFEFRVIVGAGKKGINALKIKEAQARAAKRLQAKTSAERTGLPRYLYRWVPKQVAKQARKNGVLFEGSEFDGIPCLSTDRLGAARAVGAVALGKCLKIDIHIIRRSQLRFYIRKDNGIQTYRLQCNIPKEAIVVL